MAHPFIPNIDKNKCAVDDCEAAEDDEEIHYTKEDMEYVESLHKQYTVEKKLIYTDWTSGEPIEKEWKDNIVGPNDADFIRDEMRNK